MKTKHVFEDESGRDRRARRWSLLTPERLGVYVHPPVSVTNWADFLVGCLRAKEAKSFVELLRVIRSCCRLSLPDARRLAERRCSSSAPGLCLNE